MRTHNRGYNSDYYENYDDYTYDQHRERERDSLATVAQGLARMFVKDKPPRSEASLERKLNKYVHNTRTATTLAKVVFPQWRHLIEMLEPYLAAEYFAVVLRWLETIWLVVTAAKAFKKVRR